MGRDEDRAGGEPAEDRCVGHGQQRWRVDDDVPELRGEFVDQGLHPLRTEQLARVRGDRSCRQHAQAVAAPRLEEVRELSPSGQGVGQARGSLDAHHLRQAWPPQVRVDEHHGRTALGDGDGEVRARRGLALGGYGRGDHEGAVGIVRVEVLQIGPQRSERLGPRAAGVVVDDQRAFVGVLVEADAADEW